MNSLILCLIQQLMYQDMTFSLLVNGCQSPQQQRNCGLLQGSPLSPILFNRFVNGLLQALNHQSLPTFPNALFFADDGVLISPTMRKAQILLNRAQEWAAEHGMSFNIGKCGYLRTHSASQLLAPPPLYINAQPLPHVSTYKYLGVIFSTTGIDFQAQADLLSQRLQKHLSAICWFHIPGRLAYDSIFSKASFSLPWNTLSLYYTVISFVTRTPKVGQPSKMPTTRVSNGLQVEMRIGLTLPPTC